MKKTLLIFALAAGLLSCSDDDDKGETVTLQNFWTLTELTGEMEPQSYSPGEYSWEISGDILTVQENANSDLSFLLPEGTYLIEADNDSFDILTEGFEGTYGYSIHHGNLHVVPPGAEFDAMPYMEFEEAVIYAD